MTSPSLLPASQLQRRLLTDAASHAPISVLAMLALPPLLWWLHRHYSSARLMDAWVPLMWLLAGAMLLVMRRLRVDPPSTGDADRRWRGGLMLLAVLVGLGWAAPVPITLHERLPLFHLVLYASLCAVTSSGAMYLSLLPAMFLCFSGSVLAVALAGTYWIFPQDWPFMVAALLLFSGVTLRHARQNRRFIERQLALEEGYREMGERAAQALLEKNHFLNAASHDLRQPVHAMRLAVEAGLQLHGQDARLVPLLEHLEQCGRNIHFMLESLLDLARVESGRQTAQPQTLSVNELLADVPVLFAAPARANGLALRLRAPRHRTLCVRTDPALLRQALFNLVQNAIRYTSRGGVLVAARTRGATLLLQVWDTGVGIAAQEQARIFAPFERGSAAAARGQVAAHGLGLAVVARSAALIGAKTGVHSALGRGSCFWLQLPLAEESAAPAQPALLRRTEVRSLPGRCLVVEDEPRVVQSWRMLFGAWGTTVRFADSHASAHRHLDEGFRPQALICDLRLRGGDDGWRLLQSLATRCPDAGYLLVSADLAAPEINAADDFGCLVLYKPVEPDELYRALRAWMTT